MNNSERFEIAAATAGVALLLSPDAHAAAIVEPAQDNLTSQGLSLEVNNGWNWNQPEATDPGCKAPELKWEVVVKQVPFIDLERYGLGDGTGRKGILDKGVKAPMDPVILKPALGGMVIAKSLDGTKEYDTDRISQTTPKLDPKVKVTDLDKNLGWAHLQFCAVPNDTAVHPITGKKIPSLALTLLSSQDMKNDTYDTVIPAGGVAVHWFGREVGIEKVENKIVMDYAKVMEILDDRNQPFRDLPVETRANLRKAVSEKLQQQRLEAAQKLEAEKATRTQKPADEYDHSNVWEQIKSSANTAWEWVKSNPVPVAIMAVLLAGLLLARSDKHLHIRNRRVI